MGSFVLCQLSALVKDMMLTYYGRHGTTTGQEDWHSIRAVNHTSLGTSLITMTAVAGDIPASLQAALL